MVQHSAIVTTLCLENEKTPTYIFVFIPSVTRGITQKLQ